MTDRERTSGDPWRALLVGAAALAVVGAAVVVLVSAISTSSARVAASTSSEGLLSTATIELTQPDTAVELLLDGDGLYPGVDVVGCVVIEYTGTIPVLVRLHGVATQSGLDPYIDFRLVEQDGRACPAASTPAADSSARGTEIYRGRLDVFWQRHGSFASGLEFDRQLVSGDRLVIAAGAIVVDDNRAQGLSTDFTLIVEARPA